MYCQKITRLAEQLKDPEKIEVAKLKLAFVLLSSGLFKETFAALDSIDPRRLTQDDKQRFYFFKFLTFSDFGDFNQDQTYRPAYDTKALAFADTALQSSRPGSYEYLSVQEFRAQKTNNLPAGAAVYRQIRRLPEDQLLTTELRIFALIRLGIADSEQISRMLGYSINTIYTYKTSVKNRAFLRNEEFEARIQAI